tara:strand:+ start:3061 stop:3513 length:453 start_codon:yes stop_codon:yes gene_type:complete
MPIGHIRAGLVAAFAVIFGIVQLLCACIDISNVAEILPQSSASHQMSINGHDHHAMINMSEQHTTSHDHGEHNHETDCSHCDDTVVLAGTADVTPSVFTKPTVLKTAYIDKAPVKRADMAATNLAGLRWLDPPRRLPSSNPVTLHTRSLI